MSSAPVGCNFSAKAAATLSCSCEKIVGTARLLYAAFANAKPTVMATGSGNRSDVFDDSEKAEFTFKKPS